MKIIARAACPMILPKLDRKSSIALYLALMPVLIGISFCVSFLFNEDFSKVFNPVVIFLGVALCGLLYTHSPLVFFLAFPFYFPQLWAIFSNIYIESGAYIVEQGRYGEWIGSSSRLTSFTLLGIFFITLPFLKERFLGSPPAGKSVERLFLKFFVCFFAAGLTFIVLFYGAPLLSHEIRFEYWKKLPDVLRRFRDLSELAALASGLLFFEVKKKKYIVALMMVVVLMLILLAEKFTSVFWVAIYFLVGHQVAMYFNKGEFYSLSKVLFGFLFPLFSFLLPLVIYGYVIYHGSTFGEVGDKIINRALALQGHVWFGVDFMAQHSSLPEGKNIIDFFRPGTAENPSGLVMLMYAVAPNDLVEYMLSNGVTFTTGYPSIALYLYGYLGLFAVQVICGLLIGFFLNAMADRARKKRFFALIVYLLMYKFLVAVFVMGFTNAFTNPIFIALAGVIALEWVLSKSLEVRHLKLLSFS